VGRVDSKGQVPRAIQATQAVMACRARADGLSDTIAYPTRHTAYSSDKEILLTLGVARAKPSVLVHAPRRCSTGARERPKRGWRGSEGVEAISDASTSTMLNQGTMKAARRMVSE
jgi:hypothetical protein